MTKNRWDWIKRHTFLPSAQDQLEEVLDVVLANQCCMLAERHAQRKFLVHSLHSLKGLISDTFASSSSHLDLWFTHIRRLVSVICTDRVVDPLQITECM